MKILVAEDESTSALVLRRSLEKLGHEVVVVEDGEAAWEVLSREANRPGGGSTFDALISDWMMPNLDGVQLVQRIRARAKDQSSCGDLDDGNGYLYVVLLTAKGRPEDRLMAMEAGVDDFLVKPLDQGELVARIEVAKRILALQQDVQSNAKNSKKDPFLQQGGPLGEILLSQGAITDTQLRQALDQRARTGGFIGLIFLANGWVTEEDITRARSVQMDVTYVSVGDETPDESLLEIVPLDIAERYQMMPLTIRPDGVVRVAVVNPWNIEGLDTVQRLTGRRALPLLATEAGVMSAITRFYKDVEGRRKDALLTETFEKSETSLSSLNARASDHAPDDIDTDAALAANSGGDDEAPVIRLINAVLADGVRRRASDVHIEPYKTDWEIRYRIDGELQTIRTLPRQILASAISRIKVMAEMDISERRIPQDGRISLKVDGRGVDLRVSSLPTQFGERMVLRVLDRASARLSLDKLDFGATNRQTFDGLIRRPHGIILVTGPTGSGKTTTLYASLNALRSPTTNIMTCEDPIEYELDRISQSNVNPKAGLTFSSQLRAILRQDPDVVLVGEIRDAETAETAFRAALTGHLVLSTLHCNEAAGAPTRLLDMGVPPFLIASALIGVVAQRLVKRLCPHCAQPFTPDFEKRRLMEMMCGGVIPTPETLYAQVGCDQCDNAGTHGRVGVHEVLAVNERIQSLIMQQADTRVLREAALQGGMVPMIGDGLEKASRGLTTLDDVQRRLAGELTPSAKPETLRLEHAA